MAKDIDALDVSPAAAPAKPLTYSQKSALKKQALADAQAEKEEQKKIRDAKKGPAAGPLVKAVRAGYYNEKLQSPGSILKLQSEEDFSDAEYGGWMVKTEKDPHNLSKGDLEKLKKEKELSNQVDPSQQHGINIEPIAPGNPVAAEPPFKPKKKADEDVI